MKKIFILCLISILIMFFVIVISPVSVFANISEFSIGTVVDLSNEISSFNEIKIEKYNISSIDENSQYFFYNKELNETLCVDNSAKFSYSNVDNLELKIKLNSLPDGYGVLYNNSMSEESEFFIDRVSYVKSFNTDNQITFKFFNSMSQELSIIYDFEILGEEDFIEYEIIQYRLNVNNVFFNINVRVEKIQNAINELEISDSIYLKNSYSTAENTVFLNKTYIENVNAKFKLNYNFFYTEGDDIEVIYTYTSAIIQSCFEYFDNKNYLDIFYEILTTTFTLNFNIYIDEDLRDKSSFVIEDKTINLFLSNDANDLCNISTIIHEISHFILYLNSSIVSYSNIDMTNAPERVVAGVFNESIATFFEYHYIFIENELHKNENYSNIDIEISRLFNFANDYYYSMFFDCFFNKNLDVLGVSNYGGNYLLYSEASLIGSYDYTCWVIFDSVYNCINNEIVFFDKLYEFLNNYQNYYDALSIENYTQTNSIAILTEAIDSIFINYIKLNEINESKILYNLMISHINGFEGLDYLNQNSISSLWMSDNCRTNLILNPDDFIFFRMSEHYLSITLLESMNVQIYDSNNILQDEMDTASIKLCNTNESDYYYVLIYNDNDYDIKFSYEYYALRKYNNSTLNLTNNSNYTSKFLFKLDDSLISKLKISATDLNENSEIYIDVYSLSKGIKINEIQLNENSFNESYYYFEENEYYIVSIRINNYNLYENVEDICINFYEDHSISGEMLINHYYFINDIKYENLLLSFKYDFEAYGIYSIIVAMKNKELIYSNFITLAIKIDNEKNIYVYENLISTENPSFIIDLNVNYGDQVFIIMENDCFESDVYFEANLVYDNSKSFNMIPDSEGENSSLYGTEIRLNNGEFNSNLITIGFSRCLFLPESAPSLIRQNYYWFSSNKNIAEVSNFGTVLGKCVGYVTIFAVYINDPTIVGLLVLNVTEDPSEDEVSLMFGLDVRSNGIVSGTDVTDCNQLSYPVNYYDQFFTINEGKTKLICLGTDAPSQYLQHFDWSSNDESIRVSEFGTIFALSKNDTECTITGVYRFNSRFRVKIKLIVV